MLRKIDNTKMGESNLGWLQSKFHFSFAEYYNPKNMHFGELRVINDDLVKPGTGFGVHPHRDMEIVTYVVDGELTHGDSMGNKETIGRGHVQYMSAGTGVLHSEYNLGDEMLRFLQIWILPDANGYKPNYGDHRFNWDDRVNKWLNIVSPQNGDAKIKIHQDASIYVVELDEGKSIDFEPPKMWGPTMIGFGKYHYKSNRSKQEGDWFVIGFSPRKAAISVYVYSGTEKQDELLKSLGKYKMGKACIYVNKLADINLDVLKQMMIDSIKHTKEVWG